MKIKIPQTPKKTIVEIYDHKYDDSPQVITFVGDKCISTRYQTTGKELLEDYAKILQHKEKDEYGKTVLVIQAFKRW